MPPFVAILIGIFINIWSGLPVAAGLHCAGESRLGRLFLHALVGGVLVLGLVSQICWKLGWNAHQAAWPFLGIVSILNVLFLVRIVRRRAELERADGAGMFAVAAVALLLVSVFAANGGKSYYGRAWGDQVNYSLMANFLQFSSPTTVRPPYTRPAEATLFSSDLLRERIGQSTLHAWVNEFTGVNVLESFYGVCVLGVLAVCATLYLIGRELGAPPRWAATVAIAAAASPPLCAILLESFLSQVTGTPFVFYAVLVSYQFATTGRRIWLALLLLCAMWILAAYFEFFPVLIVAEGALLAALLWCAPKLWKRYALLWVALPVGLKLAYWLNPNLQSLILRGVATHSGFEKFFPWAYSPEGFARVWVGDWVTLLHPAMVVVLALAAASLAVWTIFRLILLSWQKNSALALPLAALVTLPLGALILPGEHSYQFYKLLQSVWPLAILGLLPFGASLENDGTRRVRTAILSVVLVVPGAAAWSMLRTEAVSQSPRSGMSPYLQLHGQDVVDRLVQGRPEKHLIINMPQRREYNDVLTNGILALQLSPRFPAIQTKWINVGEYPHDQPLSPIVPADPAVLEIRSIQPEFLDHLADTLVLQVGATYLQPAPELMRVINSTGRLTLYQPVSHHWLVASTVALMDPAAPASDREIQVGNQPAQFVRLDLESDEELPDGVGLEIQFAAPSSSPALRWHIYSSTGYGTYFHAENGILRLNSGHLRRGVTGLYFGLAPEKPSDPASVKITRIVYGL